MPPSAGGPLQEQGKTTFSTRTASVAEEVLELLRGRDRSLELVFPSMKGHLRDTGNTEADWRANPVWLGCL